MNTIVDKDEQVIKGSVEEEEEGIMANIPYLNQDNIGKILAKIPSPESLFGLRCVCKNWFNIIIDHQYYSNSPLLMHPINREPPGILIQCGRQRHHDYYTLFLKLGKERNQVEQVVDLTSCFKDAKIRDCFNGVISAHTESPDDDYGFPSTYRIFNPVTKQRMKVPPWFHAIPSKLMFLPSTGEYIGVQLTRTPLYPGSYYVRIARLFRDGDWVVDDKNLQWKLIKVPNCISISVHDYPSGETFFTFEGDQHAINGILYLTPSERETTRKYIAYFDAGEETFYKIPHPDFDPFFNIYTERRWYSEIEGSLGYIRFDTASRPHYDRLEIYILKDADQPAEAAADHKVGGKEWIKQHSIRLAPSILRHQQIDRSGDMPVCVLRNGEVILFMNFSDKHYFRVYDVKLDRWLDLGVDFSRGSPIFVKLHSQRTVPFMTSLSHSSA